MSPVAYEHYLPVRKDLADLVQQGAWARAVACTLEVLHRFAVPFELASQHIHDFVKVKNSFKLVEMMTSKWLK